MKYPSKFFIVMVFYLLSVLLTYFGGRYSMYFDSTSQHFEIKAAYLEWQAAGIECQKILLVQKEMIKHYLRPPVTIKGQQIVKGKVMSGIGGE